MYTHNKLDAYFVNGKCQCDINSRCQNRYCNGNLLRKIIGHINSAQTTISIAMYNITNREIVDSIIEASERNVSVRVITDESNCKGQVKLMEKAG